MKPLISRPHRVGAIITRPFLSGGLVDYLIAFFRIFLLFFLFSPWALPANCRTGEEAGYGRPQPSDMRAAAQKIRFHLSADDDSIWPPLRGRPHFLFPPLLCQSFIGYVSTFSSAPFGSLPGTEWISCFCSLSFFLPFISVGLIHFSSLF